jgi:hypothetical protein
LEEGVADVELISKEEETFFRTEGYLLLRGAISPAEVATLIDEVNRLVEEAAKNSRVLREAYYDPNSFKLDRIYRLSPAFDNLIDHPNYFGRLVSLIGIYIQVLDAEIFVRGPSKGAITGFHTDLGLALQKFVSSGDNPFLQIKAQIFLTDLSSPDRGNFALIPGSHRIRVAESDQDCYITDINRQIGPDGKLPPGSLQVLAQPGDVLLFPHSLWHAVGPNRFGVTRKSITIRYGQAALRPLERYDSILADGERNLTPRQRRVLGDWGIDDTNGPYNPPDQAEVIYGA